MVPHQPDLHLEMTLSDAELDRYARHIVLREIGGTGQARLKAARVLLVGAGGIGSPAIQYLAAAGVGHLAVIDDDKVALSNLQRQTLYGTRDIGHEKVVAASIAARKINPHTDFEAIKERIAADNALRLIEGIDVVVDGSDNFATRLAVADACLRHRTPLISAAVAEFEGQLAVYRGWEASKPCYRCFVGDDPEREGVTCAEQGVLGALTGVMGSLAALEAIRAIVPFGEDPAGKLLLVDALGFRMRVLALPKDAGCPGCGQP